MGKILIGSTEINYNETERKTLGTLLNEAGHSFSGNTVSVSFGNFSINGVVSSYSDTLVSTDSIPVGDVEISENADNEQDFVSNFYNEKSDNVYGLSVNIYNTYMYIQLVNTVEGTVFITKIIPCKNDKVSIIGKINEFVCNTALFAGVDSQDISSVVISGNTKLLHIISDTVPVNDDPFEPSSCFGIIMRGDALELEVKPSADVYFIPVTKKRGAAVIAAALGCGFNFEEETRLIVEIAGNSSAVLVHKNDVYVSSCATEELENFKCYSPAVTGSLYAILHGNGGHTSFTTVDDTTAVGVCTTGLMNIAAHSMENGAVIGDMTLRDGIVLPQNTLETAVDAANRIADSVNSVMSAAGISYDELKKIYVSTGDGREISPLSLFRLGILPSELRGRIHTASNASAYGCRLLLWNFENYSEIAQKLSEQINEI